MPETVEVPDLDVMDESFNSLQQTATDHDTKDVLKCIFWLSLMVLRVRV